jgi:hypothetical protein
MRTLHAEWTKLRTVPSSWWLLAAAFVMTVAVGAGTVSAVNTHACVSAAACHEDTVKLSLSGVWLGQAAVLILGVLAMGNEYGTGMIRTTLTAMPHRWALLVAKAAVLCGSVMAAGAPAVLASLYLGRLILPGNGFTAAAGYPPASLTDGPTLRAAAGSVLVLGLIALLGIGLATVIRDTAGATTLGLALLYIVPLLAEMLSDPHWQQHLRRWAPMPAGLSIQATRNLARLPIAPWPGLGVLAAYAAGAVVAGALVLRVRDV